CETDRHDRHDDHRCEHRSTVSAASPASLQLARKRVRARCAGRLVAERPNVLELSTASLTRFQMGATVVQSCRSEAAGHISLQLLKGEMTLRSAHITGSRAHHPIFAFAPFAGVTSLVVLRS